MTILICPCCGENYHVDVEVQTGRKVFCGKCQRKHIYYNYALVPFAIELSPRGSDRRISCPFCQRHFLIDKQSIGEYCCTGCGIPFYVPQKPEVFAQGTETSCGMVPPPAPPSIHAPIEPEKLPAESCTKFDTEPLMDSPLELPTGEISAEEKKGLENPEVSEHKKIASAITVRIQKPGVKSNAVKLPDIFAGKSADDTGNEKVPVLTGGKKLRVIPVKPADGSK